MLTPSFATGQNSLRIRPQWIEGRGGFPRKKLGRPSGHTHGPGGGEKENRGVCTKAPLHMKRGHFASNWRREYPLNAPGAKPF